MEVGKDPKDCQVQPLNQYCQVSSSLLNHVLLEIYIYPSLKHLQGWWLLQFPGKDILMFGSPSSKAVFPNIQSKPSLVKWEAFSSCPILFHLGDKTDPHPGGQYFPAAARDMDGHFFFERALLTYVQLRVCQDPQVLFCASAFQTVSLKLILAQGVTPY